MHRFRVFWLLGLAACTTTSKPAAIVPLSTLNPLQSPCRPPANSPPLKTAGVPVVRATPVLPDAAREHRVEGCAGVSFRLTDQGKTVEARAVAESPQGFGFGDAALTALAGDTFNPGQSTTDWRYAIFVFKDPEPKK